MKQLVRFFVLGIMGLLALLASGTVEAKPSAAVILNKGAAHDSSALIEIATALDTKTVRDPNKTQFLSAVSDAEIIYINSHLYQANLPHFIDRAGGKGGGMVVGEVGLTGAGSLDLVLPKDVQEAFQRSSQRPRLVIIGGCSAGSYDWPSAFGAELVICSREAVVGAASDIYFSHFLKAWTGGKTIDESFEYANLNAPKDPRTAGSIANRNAMEEWITGRFLVVQGNRAILYMGVGGSWTINQVNATGARYTGTLVLKEGQSLAGSLTWANHAPASVEGTFVQGVLKFRADYGNGLIGNYEARLSKDGDTLENGSAYSYSGGKTNTGTWTATRSR